MPGRQFDEFLHGWDSEVQRIIHDNCTEQLLFYRHPVNPVSRSDHVTRLVECILANTPEFRKIELAASAVILGLIPTLLLQFAPSGIELSLLALRKPVLAFLLGAGSCGAYLSRALNFPNPVDMLEDSPARNALGVWSGGTMGAARGCGGDDNSIKRFLEVAGSYIFALSAVVNVIHLSAWTIGEHGITASAWDVTFLPLLWTELPLLIHLVSYIFLRLSVRTDLSSPPSEPSTSQCATSSSFFFFLLRELTPSRLLPPIRLTPRRSLLAPALWILVCIGVALHMLFGTLVLSSPGRGVLVRAEVPVIETEWGFRATDELLLPLTEWKEGLP